MSKTTFCQLAKSYTDQAIVGWMMSEKLDGMRCIWDGGISIGMNARLVPWANPNETRIATGLWSRLEHVIACPEDYTNGWPKMLLDGELYSKKHRQDIMSIVKRHKPDARWKEIGYWVFDMLGLSWITDRNVSETHFARYIKVFDWIRGRISVYNLNNRMAYERLMLIDWPSNMKLLKQITIDDLTFLDRELEMVVGSGGEGLMVKRPDAYYTCERTSQLLKIKRFDDAEGTVIGWTPGEGKLSGMCGSLELDIGRGLTTDCRGLTDEESRLEGLWPVHFPKGIRISYKYNGLTKVGKPNFPRYYRKRATDE